MKATLVLALSLAATDMHRAARDNDVTKIKALVAAGASVEAQDDEKLTPLHVAASQGHADAIKALVAAGASVEAQAEHKMTPLHLAASQGHADAIKALVAAGASVEAQADEKNSPISSATPPSQMFSSHHNLSHRAAMPSWEKVFHANLRLVDCIALHTDAQFGKEFSLLSSLLRLRPEGGRYVEIGAYGGGSFSSTVMLEQCFTWTGVLIEASPETFDVLQRKRGLGPSRLVHSAICRGDGTDGRPLPTVPFTVPLGNKYSLGYSLHRHGMTVADDNISEVFQVPCQSLESILYPLGSSAPVGDVDFLSLDVEGAEELVMQTVDPRHFQLVLVKLNRSVPPKDDQVRRMLTAGGLEKSRLEAGHLNEVYTRNLESKRAAVVDMAPPRGFWLGRCDHQKPGQKAFNFNDRCAVGAARAQLIITQGQRNRRVHRRIHVMSPRQCILKCLDVCKDRCKYVSFSRLQRRCVWNSECNSTKVVNGRTSGFARHGYFTVAIESMRTRSLFANDVASSSSIPHTEYPREGHSPANSSTNGDTSRIRLPPPSSPPPPGTAMPSITNLPEQRYLPRLPPKSQRVPMLALGVICKGFTAPFEYTMDASPSVAVRFVIRHPQKDGEFDTILFIRTNANHSVTTGGVFSTWEWFNWALRRWQTQLIGHAEDDVLIHFATVEALLQSIIRLSPMFPRLVVGQPEIFHWDTGAHGAHHYWSPAWSNNIQCSAWSKAGAYKGGRRKFYSNATRGMLYGPFPFPTGPFFFMDRTTLQSILANSFIYEEKVAMMHRKNGTPWDDVFFGFALSMTSISGLTWFYMPELYDGQNGKVGNCRGVQRMAHHKTCKQGDAMHMHVNIDTTAAFQCETKFRSCLNQSVRHCTTRTFMETNGSR